MEAQTVTAALSFPRLAYSLAESEALSGISRSTLYRLMERGELHSVKIGDRRFIPAHELRRLCGSPTTSGASV